MQQEKNIADQIEETLVTFGASRVGDWYEWNGTRYGSFAELKAAIGSADSSVVEASKREANEARAKAQAATEAAKAERAKKALSKGELIGAAVLVCGLIYVLTNFRGTPENHESSLILAAHRHCNSYVSDRLVSPSSADFPTDGVMANKVGNNHYVIMSKFQAKNAFGVMLSGLYTCNVQWNGVDKETRSNWSIVSLTLDNF